MTWSFAESHIEEAALAWLAELRYATATGIDIGPDGSTPERANYSDVLLIDRLRAAIERLNPALTAETRAEVTDKLVQADTPLLVTETGGYTGIWSKAFSSMYGDRMAPLAVNRSDLLTSTIPTPTTGSLSTSIRS